MPILDYVAPYVSPMFRNLVVHRTGGTHSSCKREWTKLDSIRFRYLPRSHAAVAINPCRYATIEV